MKILILSDRIPPENSGGAEKVAWSLARGLQAHGHTVHAIAATNGAGFEEVREGIPTYHVPVSYPDRWQAICSLYNPPVTRALRELYARIQPDVVSAFNIHHDLTYDSVWLARRMGIPAVLNAQDVMAFAYNKLTHYIDPTRCDYAQHEYRLPPLYNLRTMRLRYNPARNLFIRHVLNRQASACVAGSEAHRQTLAANGLPRFEVVYGSVVPADFEASEAAVDALKSRLDLHGRAVILFAGRLSADKGSHQLLSALDQVIRDVPQAILLTLTRATLEQQGLTAPEVVHLRDHVRVGGWMQGEELAAAYRAARVVVVPSVCMDTFPTVNLEAMAARKPVIATCFGGSPEAVAHGETGYIVNPYDTATFAGYLRQLLTDDARAAEMGAAGYRRLLERFTLERHVREMLAIYERVTRR